ncbi:hypothetical protein DAEQUDRAFT_720072 [Daedalea quercina L-15889]|uniref:Aprataxin and PNK-like factor PBZ domain-containing protein n=1 Tax=Daedalea quercina L-15889 TaxID=1314783 RepID=A0A165UGU0_9APHY|nr:hypothetical protein DAEQUDRAFT_720072 [Daedalea quercina L-15889]
MLNAVPFNQNTSVMSFAALTEDVLDEVLRRLPDFNTLAATIRTSKQLSDIFKAHPKSITRNVAENTCGHPDVLPAALRLVRKVLKGDVGDDDDDDDDDIVIAQEPPEDEMLASPLTREEARLLDRYGEVVRSMEDIYSWRHKDPASSTTRLTPLEAVRFKRGMHRFWLFCECYSPPEYDDGDDDCQAARDRAANECLRLLLVEDLFEVGAVAAFCAEMYEWNCKAWSLTPVNPPYADFYRDHTCVGPEQILQDFQHLYSSQPEGAENSGFFWTSFEHAVTRFQLSQQSRDDRLVHAIIREDVRAGNSCDRCHAVRGIDLWGSTNWPLLRGFLSLDEVRTLLPGRLQHNSTETKPLCKRLGSEFWLVHRPRPEADEVFTNLMKEMIQLPVDDAVAWSADEWYCHDCVRELFKQRLWRWWHAKKREAGTPEMEDCWYGYNCRTMVHRQAHAEKLNHLCVPTKGDA